MSRLRRAGAVVALSLTLAVSAFAGIIHSPGKQDPPPPPSEEETAATTTSTSITTEMLLTILSLIR